MLLVSHATLSLDKTRLLLAYVQQVNGKILFLQRAIHVVINVVHVKIQLLFVQVVLMQQQDLQLMHVTVKMELMII